MPQHHFTARWVETVKSPEAGQVDYFDTSAAGVGLRLASGGRKTWFVMYRAHGRLRRLTLGTYPALSLADARGKALEIKLAVAQGADPATQRQQARAAPLFAEIAAQDLDKHAKVHKKSWQDDARLLRKEVLPAWGKRQAVAITRRDILTLLDSIVERGSPVQANRVLALVRKVFNWAISRDLLAQSPCVQIRPPGKEHQRDRVLNDEEIRAVWQAFGQLDGVLGAYFKVRLLTAQRGGEVRTMRWEDIDLETGWWTIPPHATKNSLAHRVPLSQPAQVILRTAKQSAPGPWVFPSPRRTDQPIVNVRKPALRLQEATGLAFVPHDLRRTAASHMTSLGIPRLVVGKILNHVEAGVTRVYDRHSYDAEKRQAIEAWGQKVMTLAAGPSPNVIPMRRKA